MHDGFRRQQQDGERRDRHVRKVSVGRSSMTPISTTAIMMKERWVATSAPESTR